MDPCGEWPNLQGMEKGVRLERTMLSTVTKCHAQTFSPYSFILRIMIFMLFPNLLNICLNQMHVLSKVYRTERLKPPFFCRSDDSERDLMVSKLFVTITFLLSSLHSYIYIITPIPKQKSLDYLLWHFISMLYSLAKHILHAQAAIPCTGSRRSAQFLNHRRTCNYTGLQDDHVPAFNRLHPEFKTLLSTCCINIGLGCSEHDEDFI
jgi:hypothetical protein